jgi:hypothetical protein
LHMGFTLQGRRVPRASGAGTRKGWAPSRSVVCVRGARAGGFAGGLGRGG